MIENVLGVRFAARFRITSVLLYLSVQNGDLIEEDLLLDDASSVDFNEVMGGDLRSLGFEPSTSYNVVGSDPQRQTKSEDGFPLV